MSCHYRGLCRNSSFASCVCGSFIVCVTGFTWLMQDIHSVYDSWLSFTPSPLPATYDSCLAFFYREKKLSPSSLFQRWAPGVDKTLRISIK